MTEIPDEEQVNRVIAARLKEARQRRGMTQAEVCQELGKHESWLSHIERGGRGVTRAGLARLAEVYGYPLPWFYDLHYEEKGPDQPRSDLDWRRLFPGDPLKAQVFFELDKLLERYRRATAT